MLHGRLYETDSAVSDANRHIIEHVKNMLLVKVTIN